MIQYLVDTSAAARYLHKKSLYPAWIGPIDSGLVGMCQVTRLEMGKAVRRAGERDRYFRNLETIFPPVEMHKDAYDEAELLQLKLTDSAAHESASPVDLLLAANARLMGMAVLHVDKDFITLDRICGLPQKRMDTTAP
ncbi:PIN domain-containing protein [Kitasatospora sp. NPDC054768]